MAGLAYANTFTVESFYNGKHYIYVTTVVDGIPNSVFMSDQDTTQPNGLKLSVPVDYGDVSQFLSTAQILYTYFEHKPKLNIDLDITRDSSDDISDTWFFDNTSFLNSHRNYVLMSNVIYEIPDNAQLQTKGLRNVVLVVPTGSVSINPGRESISLSKTSISYLNTRFQEIANTIVDKFRNLVHNQTTQRQKLKTYHENLSSIPYPIRESSDLSVNEFMDPKFFVANSNYRWFMSFHDTSNFKAAYPNIVVNVKEIHRSTLSSYLNIDDFIKDIPVVVLDLKTKFSHLIQDYNTALVLRPKDKKDMDSFLLEVKKFKEDFGLPNLEYLSDKVGTVDAPEKVDRSGIYVCPIQNTSVRASTKEDTSKEYWYFDVTQTSPDMEYSRFTDLVSLYERIPSDKKKPLVGIQKKYRNKVQNSNRYSEAEGEILTYLKSQKLTVYGKNMEQVFHSLYNVVIFPRVVDIAPEFKEIEPDLIYRKTHYPAKASLICTIEDQEILDKYEIPYTIKDIPYSKDYLLQKFPFLNHMTWRVDDETKAFIVDREIYYQQRPKDEIRTSG